MSLLLFGCRPIPGQTYGVRFFVIYRFFALYFVPIAFLGKYHKTSLRLERWWPEQTPKQQIWAWPVPLGCRIVHLEPINALNLAHCRAVCQLAQLWPNPVYCLVRRAMSFFQRTFSWLVARSCVRSPRVCFRSEN